MMKKCLTVLTALLQIQVLYGQTCVPSDIYDVEDANAVCIEIDATNTNVRMIYSNNYPDHDDNYNQSQFTLTADDYEYSVCAYPEEASSFTPLYEETEKVGCTFTYRFGVSINGVKYDPNSAETFVNDDDSNNLDWHVEATSTENSIGQNMGTDNGGHLNPFGEYHYHAVPTDYFVNDLGIDGSAHSPIVGWAADGFPIYYKYVYRDAEDDLSAIETASSGYTLRSGSRGGDGLTAPDGDYDGNYYEDYEYSSASTILDECNGRYGVTPDYEYGTYYYVITDEYPYIPRCFKGIELDNTFRIGPSASCDDSEAATNCAAAVSGCMDPFSTNYNENANVDDGSCTYVTITWNGSTWSNTTGPGANDEVALSADYVFSEDGSFESGELTVETGAVLTVDGESTLVVNGDLNLEGDLEVHSGSSLITYDTYDINRTTGEVIIYKNTRYSGGQYSMVGTPVKQDASITGADLGTIAYKYNETTGFADQGLNRWESALTDQLEVGKGYAQAFQGEIMFTGIPNDGDISYTGTFTDLTNSNPEGWNLVSNPYPSAISVTSFLSANDNIEGSIYLWDDHGSDTERGTNDDYIIVNGITSTQNSQAGNEDRYNRHLGTAQGFFVKLLDDTDLDIDFTESMRVSGENSDDHFFREAEEEIPFVRLNLMDETGLFKQMVIGWVDGIQDHQMNRLYDAPVFDPKSSNLIYSIKLERELGIQGISYDETEVPLGINVSQSGAYQIQMDAKNYHGNPLYLMDHLEGTAVDLSEEPYAFSSSEGQIRDRFTVSVTDPVLVIEESKTQVYAFEKTLIIKTTVDQPAEYQLFSLSGQKMFSATVTGSKSIDLNHLPHGVYLIHHGKESQKIILK